MAPSDSKVRIVDGRHDFSEPGLPENGTPYLMLLSVAYGDLDGDGMDEAAVDLLYGSGGTANWHYLYVYTLAGNAPKLLGLLRSGSRADGGLVGVAIRDKRLVLEFEDAARRQGDCCSEGYIRARYRWQGNRFVEVGSREHGDLK